jgi:hypothetical protein
LDWTKPRAENARKEMGRRVSREPEASDERLVRAALISAESRVTDLDELAHFYGDGLRLAVTVDQ